MRYARLLVVIALCLCLSCDDDDPPLAPTPSTDTDLNVKDFGAVGTGEVDDAPAIQRAFDQAAENGGSVYFPAGLYRVGDAVYVYGHNVTVRGEGESSLIFADGALRPKGPNGVLVVGLERDKVGAPTSNVIVQELALDAGFMASCLYAAGVADLIVSNIVAQRSFGPLVNTALCTDPFVIGCKLSVARGKFGDGVLFGGATRPSAIENVISDFTRIGVVAEAAGAVNSSDVSIINNIISNAHNSLERQHNAGVWLENTDGGDVVGNLCTDLHDAPVTGYSFGIVVAGGSLRECTFNLIGNDIADARYGCRIVPNVHARVFI